MELSKLISIGAFTFLLVITIYGWRDRLSGTNAAIREGFEDRGAISEADLAKVMAVNEPVPTDADATKAHQTLLRYMRNDFGKGVKFLNDITMRFYGVIPPFRKDLNLGELMQNYSSPLQGI